ncbi:ABC exporter membrane fusion protein [Leptolyngbya sp. NK1-12]|uniref:ABC exporter membrane fusion protein n=1 Tax=Leptolyngbya sp. NK1-12 TaxID=2547451 RepID=A0AA96WS60_9CYAN|nr:ABC exporter membrane fusion protein [Leptolyngbya sp. NK1-12]MBF2048129.1 ABC exporter membrane fusion protein [Elainella sp. C42_A2020_010]RNJ65235.1 MAG: HlyD family efflux transporter periplasmic adaptor subunit [Leptolyngbya sp. IPPAS B-1204]WNZ21717.1 ABC exporter membrane fusion protein [Leptolyngbya sp. NK1-12]
MPRDGDQSFRSNASQWVALLSVSGMLAVGAAYFYNSYFRVGSAVENAVAAGSATPEPVVASPVPANVSALGRIEPQGKIVRLSAPSSLQGSQVRELLVQEGQQIQAGQVIAILDSQSSREAALERAKTNVGIAKAKLAQVKAGAKQGEIEAQRAAIARLEAELRNAESEYRRNEQLFTDGAISEVDLEEKRLRVEATQEQIRQARSSLESIAEVRPEDVQIAEAELNSAIAAVRQAEADLELTYVRSPMTAQVIKIHTRPGEVIGTDGIVEIGQTDVMNVVAQVYETDIKRVQLGQKATVTGTAFSDQLSGKVSQIGLQVSRQDVFENNPLADTDNRVVEVKIQLDPESSKKVARLSNLQVQVLIQGQ